MDDAPIRFAMSRGSRIAYQVFGDGPATIVSIPPTAQNIEMAWGWPDVRYMLERFGSFSRFLHFDKRGTGASDRRSYIPGIDERVEDLRAVMDDAGIDRAHFFANSEGGPMAILFAATYPNRSESLTLWGTGASMVSPNLTDEQRAERRVRNRSYAALWGTSDSPVVDAFAPSLAANQDFRDWHRRYERAAADTDSLVELLDLTLDMDVRELLPSLDLPVLVFHRTGDRIIPVEFGRELAAGIPGAKLVELHGDDHFSYAGDVDLWMDELERFVTGEVRERTEPVAAHPKVTIQTLGKFAVVVDGGEVPGSAWGSRRARQLLKRLVAARGWPVTRDELMDLLWPDESDRQKLGARLSVQLSAVRRVLDGGVLADRESVSLDLSEVTTDLEAFYAASDDGAIVAAYSGEFLPEDVYEDWSGGTRDEARSRFVAAARRQATKHAAEGRFGPAVRIGRRLLEVDSYDEDAHRLVVDALLGAGEKGEAQRAHATWEAAMAELGIGVQPFES